MSLNNIDIEQVNEYEKEIRKKPDEARFTTVMEGIWLYDEAGPQFTAETKTKSGIITYALSHPNFAGPGVSPSPMSYGLFWIAGCASSTFMTAAEKKKIQIKSMKTRIEADLNYLKQFELTNDPLISAYRVFFDVDSDASAEELEELRRAALNGCMALFTVQNKVPLTLTVTNT